MNQQRTVVYDLRNKALLSEDMSETVLDAIDEAVRRRGSRKYAGDRRSIATSGTSRVWPTSCRSC